MKTNPKAEREFNQALNIFRQMRNYPEHSMQYRNQLKLVVEHTRNAISLNDRHGDAHVMLANAYFLMFIDGYPEPGNPEPLMRAAAVIQHWSDEPMRQYPWTKNRETGQTLYSQVSNAVYSSLQPNQSMVELKRSFYRTAISLDLGG